MFVYRSFVFHVICYLSLIIFAIYLIEIGHKHIACTYSCTLFIYFYMHNNILAFGELTSEIWNLVQTGPCGRASVCCKGFLYFCPYTQMCRNQI